MQKRQLVSMLGMHLRDVNTKLARFDSQFMANMYELRESSEERMNHGFRFSTRYTCCDGILCGSWLRWFFDGELNCYVYDHTATNGNYVPLNNAVYVASFGDYNDEFVGKVVDKTTLSSGNYFFTKDQCAITISSINHRYDSYHPFYVEGDGAYYCRPRFSTRRILGKDDYLVKEEDSIRVEYLGNVCYVPSEWQTKYPQCFRTCEECGALLFGVNDNFECSCSRVRFYGYHDHSIPAFTFHSLDGEEPKGYFGAEIEFIFPNNSRYTHQDYLNVLRPISRLIHCSHDGSLHCGTIHRNGRDITGADEGIEIVFHPMTWNFWKTQRSRIKKAFDKLISMGAASHDTTCCGLHVHASRTLFNGTLEQVRPILLLNGLQSSFESFARRKGGRYCDYSTSGLFYLNSSTFSSSSDSLVETSHYLTSHGYCLNYGSHSHDHNTKTIEFRLFKGTLDVDTLLASIELVKNVVEVSNNASQLGDVRFSDLIYGQYVPKYVKNRIAKGFNTREDYYNSSVVSFGFTGKERFASIHSRIISYLAELEFVKNKYEYYFVNYPEQRKLVDSLKDKLMLMKKYNLKFNLLNDETIANEYQASKEYYDAVNVLREDYNMSLDDDIHNTFKNEILDTINSMKEFNLNDSELARYANYILRKRVK